MTDLHKPVLLAESIEGLAIKPEGIYVDATFGRGGHSLAILNKLGPNGRLMALDKDPAAIEIAKSRPFFMDERFECVHAAFSTLQQQVERRDWQGRIDGMLMDLGVSSPQLEIAARGFSFLKEGPLDMRMNPQAGIDAATWLNQAAADEIADVLYQYGEERHSRRIAAAIVAARKVAKITMTTQLAEIIAKASPGREANKHPATRSFQAIRIFINDELNDLKACLQQALNVLSVGGRICVISFHSLEDRIVKRFFQNEGQEPRYYPPNFPIPEETVVRRLKKIGGLIRPASAEVRANARARSACLRIAEKIR